MSELFAFALGCCRSSQRGQPLDYYFPAPVLAPDGALAAEISASFQPGEQVVDPAAAARFAARLPVGAERDACLALAETDRPLAALRLEEDAAIGSTAEAYLKLHLLSHRLTLPNTLNLDGIFAHLPNVAWTTEGPYAVDELPAALAGAMARGRQLEVMGIDKFPKMTNYVVPTGVRIADASRIRLGAYLGEGTTVMHEGFVNFNAGALGPNMIEGRISQGVIVGAHSDLGGSSSTMGTLSGGGEIVISIGESCLIGANAGTGIPLGDRCTIAAGLYITAGTPVVVLDEAGQEVKTVKARELAGASDLLFLQNSARQGRIECRTNRQAIELNEQLHAHN
jgi:2,3,4,5-tetrahydropyridine-2-carboxylate N-succinyltransferase